MGGEVTITGDGNNQSFDNTLVSLNNIIEIFSRKHSKKGLIDEEYVVYTQACRTLTTIFKVIENGHRDLIKDDKEQT